jgi:hypothetical protein
MIALAGLAGLAWTSSGPAVADEGQLFAAPALGAGG